MSIDVLNQYLLGLAGNLVDPQKRLFVGYILAAAAIALLWGVLRAPHDWRAGVSQITKLLLTPKLWWSASAREDYKLVLANQAILMAAAPWLVSRAGLTTALYFIFLDWFGAVSPALASAPEWLIVLCFTLTQFIVDDASRYVLHRVLHRIPVLWAFHKVHHSARSLTPVTVLRSHPVEGVLFTLRATLTQALLVALFVSLFGDKVSLLTIFGAQLGLFLFNALGANLRHSPVSLGYGVLEHWFISPAQHQIHHSDAPLHHGRNFGAVLAVWDRLGGTWSRSSLDQCLSFGLGGSSRDAEQQLTRLYVEPVVDAFNCLWHFACKCGRKLTMFARNTVSPLRRRLIASGTMLLMLALAWPGGLRAAEALNIYSHRQPFLITPFLDAFTAQTGIETNVVFAAKGLAQRMQSEGQRSPADVVLTVDIARLNVYADKDLLAPVDSETLRANIPAYLRDPENRWFALSTRARVVAYAKARVAPTEIQRIEDLADPRWQGRICSRPGSHVYNRALLASMIVANGEQAAEAWAAALVANLAQRPQGNDRAQIKAIFQGVCDIAIINSYYFGKLRNSDIAEQREWVEDIGILFTNQAGRGNHINISGGGVAKHSKNKDAAVALLEFLTEALAQDLYGSINYEFPVNPAVSSGPEPSSWGEFIADDLPIGEIARLAPQAQRIIDRVGW